MRLEIIALIAGIFVLLLFLLAVFIRKVPKRLKGDMYAERWKVLQAHCRDKKTWPLAITEADKLLDKALKRRKFKGKRMGERMVSAQRKFTNNDAVWFAHNLCKKVLTDPDARLREADVKTALLGFRQALRDLGALESSESVAAKKGEK
ncbi:hypothetical protein H0X10_03915 [Candidatus Saccharibacteria bacterium]|nr:hypothetical protein [Candidatus Saccharibacteria bacterium]